MKNVLILTLSTMVIVGCVAPRSTPQKDTALDLPPLPEPMLASRTVRRTTETRIEPKIMSLAAPTRSAADLLNAPNHFATLISLKIEEQPEQQVTVRFNCAAFGFGVAYSTDLQHWTYVGEAHWDVPVDTNPFLSPGLTEHRIWIPGSQWQVLHRPDGLANQWQITLFDQTPRTDARFYMIYPLQAITGLPK